MQDDAEVTKAFEESMQTASQLRNIPSPGQLDPEAHIPVVNLEDGTRLVGEAAPKNKDLVEWLKIHPAYTVDMPSYVPVSTVVQLLPDIVLERQYQFIILKKMFMKQELKHSGLSQYHNMD